MFQEYSWWDSLTAQRRARTRGDFAETARPGRPGLSLCMFAPVFAQAYFMGPPSWPIRERAWHRYIALLGTQNGSPQPAQSCCAHRKEHRPISGRDQLAVLSGTPARLACTIMLMCLPITCAGAISRLCPSYRIRVCLGGRADDALPWGTGCGTEQ